MSQIKKGHATAKKHDLNIGNRKTGMSKLSFNQCMRNAKRDGRNLAHLLFCTISNMETLNQIYTALEKKYEPFFLEYFQKAFHDELQRLNDEK